MVALLASLVRATGKWSNSVYPSESTLVLSRTAAWVAVRDPVPLLKLHPVRLAAKCFCYPLAFFRPSDHNS